ncbi:hypothetical protein OG792_20410 [Micromonospora sp. NBC_01699]|uniref:hypothetical protein n=1 Tax=Micromonospora sp. NBC_01699 TaxID=2975984 RepID=UPI002E286F37|nr:hypothetical protein [Micromonospora sp. NBC_01699]
MTELPATYTQVFAVREYRYLFGAYLLSLLGDQLTAITVAYLVFTGTGSAALAAAFASSYLAWLTGGPLLSGLADRLPRRRRHCPARSWFSSGPRHHCGRCWACSCWPAPAAPSPSR